jgi:hypothetical protein
MSDTVIVAAITASSSIAVAVTALTLNYKLFDSLVRRIEVLEKDFKDFYKTLLDIDNRVSKLEDKIK